MVGQFPDYGKSYIDDYEWEMPNILKTKEDWNDWIKSNQPDFEDFLEKNNIFHNIEQLGELFGKDSLSEIISDDRDKKIVEILN